ncbi:unnamed protein product [Parajaminaea phylloscopi]
MWVVEGDFDGGAHRRKLLVPNKVYKIGRKAPADIVISTKTVSQETVSLQVGPFSDAEVSDFTTRPTLTIINEHASKTVQVVSDIDRDNTGSEGIEVAAQGGTHGLRSGDAVNLTSSVAIIVLWWPMEVVLGGKMPSSAFDDRVNACIELGIHLVTSPKDWITGASHLCLSNIRLTPILMLGLAQAAHIVSLEFLDDLLLAGRRKENGLEANFDLPDAGDYLPQIATTHISQETAKRQLCVNDKRRTLFRGATALFIFAGHQPEHRLQTAIELFTSCGGTAEMLALSEDDFRSDSEAQRLLRKYKLAAISKVAALGEEAQNAPDEGLVVLVDDAPTLLNQPWYQTLARATQSMNIRLNDDGPSAAVTNAVLEADARKYLNVAAAVQVREPEGVHTEQLREPSLNQPVTVVPTVPEESFHPPPTAATAATAGSTQIGRDLSPPSGSRTVSQNPVSSEGPVSQAQQPSQGNSKSRRRAGGQRVNALDQLFGPQDDDQASQGSASVPLHGAQDSQDSEQATDVREMNRQPHHRSAAKRRAQQPRTRLSDVFTATPFPNTHSPDSSPENDSLHTKTKRYRELLEEEDHQASQREAETHATTVGQKRALNDVPQRPRKRQALVDGDSCEHLDTDGARKRHLTEERHHVEQNARSHTQGGLGAEAKTSQGPHTQRDREDATTFRADRAPRGKAAGEAPDVEPDFLQALAMKKKGKRAVVDDFDIEFNNLRLTKPAKDRDRGTYNDEQYEAWQATELDDFALPVGNFVQVDFVPLLRKGPPASGERRGAEADSRWAGRPNFKKFKSKASTLAVRVAMDLSEGRDFGLGPGYLGKQRHEPDTSPVPEVSERNQPDGASSRGRVRRQVARDKAAPVSILQALNSSDSDSDDAAGSASEAQRRLSKPSGRGRSRSRSDEDDVVLRPTHVSGAGRSRKRRADLVADLDSEDEIMSEGSDETARTAHTRRQRGAAGQNRASSRRRHTKQPEVEYDDSADELDSNAGESHPVVADVGRSRLAKDTLASRQHAPDKRRKVM